MEKELNPLVSVIILCYNHGKYLDQTIRSVINQTYYNLEIVIVDNFSTDDSDEIIKKYLKIDNRISYIPMELNSYASCGVNTGIKNCLGEYINILSGDDYFNIEKIEIQLNFMAVNNFVNSFCWVNIIDDSGLLIKEHWADKLFNTSLTPNGVQKYFITNGNTLCASSAMLHRSVFEQIGLFDHRLLQLQDF
jgi:Glycosyltransferases involved in cell wall biogenesis